MSRRPRDQIDRRQLLDVFDERLDRLMLLTGVRVVEVATWAMVPMAGTLLADWGAEVIKIEHPEKADPIRGLVMSGQDPDAAGVSFMWELHNRGKRAIALDLATEGGRDVLMDLIRSADVFLTNLLPRSQKSLGLSVEDIKVVNPAIIYAAGSGMGSQGPESNRGGYDTAAYWARSGIAYKTTDSEGRFPPDLPSAGIGDITTGYLLAGGIAAALAGVARAEERPTEPLTVESSLLAAGLWGMRNEVTACELQQSDAFFGLGRNAITNPLNAPYETSDGRFIQLVMLEADKHWSDFCTRIGRPDLEKDKRFVDISVRADNASDCVKALDEVFRTRTFDEWKVALADATGVWAPVQTPREAAADGQALANEYVREAVDGEGNPFMIVGNPVKFGGSVVDGGPAPAWGEHTDQVLGDLGYSGEQLLELRIAGAIL